MQKPKQNRFTIGGSKNRAKKKAIKKAALTAMDTDKDENDDTVMDPAAYWKILKARAEWLKKH